MRRMAILVVTATILAACSGDDASDGPTSGSAAPTSETSAPAATTPPTAPVTTTTAPATTTTVPFVSATYGDPASWLCFPGVDDVCDEPAPISRVAADLSVEVVANPPAGDDAPVDCFYVYPTTSEDPTLSSDLVPGGEIGAATSQFRPFNSVCRMYAPMYRSVTVAGLFERSTDAGDRAAAWLQATDDVQEAWRHYLANDNDGRGVILIGHSQGAGHLARLLDQVIDPDPAQRALLISAYIIGGSVAVPVDGDVGGLLADIPLCRAPAQVGCVVTYSTYAADTPPGGDAIFGRAGGFLGESSDGIAGCTNPAALAGGAAPLANTFLAQEWVAESGDLALSTPFMDVTGKYVGECRVLDGISYLEISVASVPGDLRTTGTPPNGLPANWGLHIVDIPLAGGSLLTLAKQQADSYTGAS